jgi:two-component system, OmpR family, response regulator ChvI
MTYIDYPNNDNKEEVSFSGDSQNYCVCFVNMLESKEITREIANNNRIRKYYFTFINTLAAIARSFDAKVIKNTGNGLMFYFPKASCSTNTRAFKDILECGLAMIAANRVINIKLYEESLPSVSYRISANYGMVEIAKSGPSQNTDLFGSTVNVCAKINSKAPPNGMVIGEDLYQVIKDHSSYFAGYDFKEVSGYVVSSSNKEYLYKVYSVESASSSAEGKISDIHRNNNNAAFLYQDEKEKHPQHQQSKSSKIILVDDDKDILITYESILTDEGYTVEAFSDSYKALQYFTSYASSSSATIEDLVVMDIRMPDLNGLQLYYRIKAINPNIKILFISALDAAEELVAALPGIEQKYILRKPVDNEEFLNKVKTLLTI